MILMVTAMSTETFVKAMGRDMDEQSAREFRDGLLVTIRYCGLSSAVLALVGFGLLAARRWARWGAIGLYSLLAAWALFETIRELSRGRVIEGLVFGAVLLAIAGPTIAYLSRRSVRDWFRLAARLRAEHGRGPGAPGGWDRTT